jgi:glycosyltransferase involved in cell wall biosynthesis
MPRVSIITPCFNAARFIGAAIDSVQTQTFEDWEHIVVDDGSTDDSAKIVGEFACTSRRLKLILQSNSGVSDARNAGFRASSPESDYLLFLDADDVLKPRILEKLVAYLDNRPEVGVAASCATLIDSEGNTLEQWNPVRYEPTTLWLKETLPDNPRTHPLGAFMGTMIPSASLIRRNAYVSTTGFDPNLDSIEDTDLFARLAIKFDVHRIPDHLAYYRQHDQQVTNKPSIVERKRRRMVNKWEKDLIDLDSQEQKIRAATLRHWQGRYIPMCWIRLARKEFSKGYTAKSLVFLGGSFFRYLFFSLSADSELYNSLHRILKPSQ